MKICFPTQAFQGLESQVYGHFGSAAGFLIVDTETMQTEDLHNRDLHHAHGGCQPLKALAGRTVDGIVVGGIGMGALNKLQAGGVKVYRAAEGTVSHNLELLKQGQLPVYTEQFVCAGHGHGPQGHGPCR
jgi:predicted Fe-Mo cluster-binding NifX family protein